MTQRYIVYSNVAVLNRNVLFFFWETSTEEVAHSYASEEFFKNKCGRGITAGAPVAILPASLR